MQQKSRTIISAPKSQLIRDRPIIVLTLIVSLSSLATIPVALDAFTTPKVLLLSIGLSSLFALLLIGKFYFFNALSRLELMLIVAFTTGLIASSIYSNTGFKRAFIGQFGRGNGLGYYLLATLIMVTSFLIYRESSNSAIHRVLRNFSWVIGVYAILQSWGIDIAQIDTTKSTILLTLGNSNFSGGILSIFFCYNLLSTIKNNSKKISDWSLLAILLYSTFLTGAVQGILIASASIIIAGNIAIKMNFPRLFKQTIGLQIGFYFIVVVLGFLKLGPINTILSRPTLRIRFEYWNIGLQMLRDNSFFGVGPDAFYDNSAIYMAPGTLEEITYTRLDAAHNWFINLAANFGLITLIPLLILFILITIKNIQIWFFLKKSNVYHLTVSVSFVMLLVDAMVSIEQPGLGIWMYFFGGLNLAINSTITSNLEVRHQNRSNAKVLSSLTALLLSLVSSLVYFDRMLYDIKLRSDLRAIVMGQSDSNTFESLTSNAIKLRSEPEYASRAIEQLAKFGDASGIDRVSNEILEYNFGSLQSLLIRQEVLLVLDRESEACPIVESLIQREPWELILWKRQISCDPNQTTTNRKFAEITWPYVRTALAKADRQRPEYLTLLTLAAYNHLFIGKLSEADRYFRTAIAVNNKFSLQVSDEFIGWTAEPFNENTQDLILRLGTLLKT